MISAVAATPPPPGISRSITTTSGVRRMASVTASSPLPTAATISKPPARVRVARRASRNIGWSSATSTRTMSSPPQGGQFGHHPHARAVGGLDGEPAAELAGTFPHGPDADPLAVRAVEAVAVVGDGQPQQPVGGELQAAAAAAGVAGGGGGGAHPGSVG